LDDSKNNNNNNKSSSNIVENVNLDNEKIEEISGGGVLNNNCNEIIMNENETKICPLAEEVKSESR